MVFELLYRTKNPATQKINSNENLTKQQQKQKCNAFYLKLQLVKVFALITLAKC